MEREGREERRRGPGEVWNKAQGHPAKLLPPNQAGVSIFLARVSGTEDYSSQLPANLLTLMPKVLRPGLGAKQGCEPWRRHRPCCWAAVSHTLEKLTLRVTLILDSSPGVTGLTIVKEAPAEHHMISSWEQKNNCRMLEDRKNFYQWGETR